MTIVFMGSDDISCGFLSALLAAPGHTICAIVTQPDRPSGRNRKLTPSPMRTWMLKHGWKGKTLTPDNVNNPETLSDLHECNPDIIVVVAYGQILKQPLLELPRHGCLNIHLSLLPLLRGAAPIQRAMMQGFHETGVTAMKMDKGMDSGDTYGMLETPILPTDIHASLTARLIDMGCSLLLKTLDDLAAGTATLTPQDHAKKTFAPKITKADRILDWSQDAATLDHIIRAFYPKPGCIAYLPNCTLIKPLRAEVVRAAEDGSFIAVGYSDPVTPPTEPINNCQLSIVNCQFPLPGTILAMSPSGPVIACGNGTALRLLEIHPDGKPHPQSGAEFAHGYKITLPAGSRLSSAQPM